MLGHAVGSQVAQVYGRYDYLKEQAEAYEAWCDKLFVLVDDWSARTGRDKDNVVPLVARMKAGKA